MVNERKIKYNFWRIGKNHEKENYKREFQVN